MAHTRTAALVEDLRGLDEAIAELTTAVTTARASLEDARSAAADLPAVEREVADLEELQQAVRRHDTLVTTELPVGSGLILAVHP